MNLALARLRNTTVAGFFFLLPVIVVVIVLAKAWGTLSSAGREVAEVLGVHSVIGVAGTTMFTVLLIVVICYGCGLLVRFSFMAALNRTVETGLSTYLPVYNSYKAMAEKKLRTVDIPYASALLHKDGLWQPAYVVEHDQEENYVVFLPDAPETSRGHLVLARGEQVKMLPSVRSAEFDESLKKLGKGLLRQIGAKP
jgi:uncharacterized membrane protein